MRSTPLERTHTTIEDETGKEQEFHFFLRRFVSELVAQPTFFLRHAPPDYNQDEPHEILEGGLDSHGESVLNECITALEDELHRLEIQTVQIISSPRKRCRLTAQEVSKQLALTGIKGLPTQEGSRLQIDQRITDQRVSLEYLQGNALLRLEEYYDKHEAGVRDFLDTVIESAEVPIIVVSHEEVMWIVTDALGFDKNELDDESPQYAELWIVLPASSPPVTR